MTSQINQLHFVLFPFLARGHLIPMTDLAKLLAQQGALVTVMTTPVNAARVKPIFDRINDTSGTIIQLKHLRFPCEEVGLPPGCETLDKLPSFRYYKSFYTAITMLKEQAEDLFRDLKPRPSCVISDPLMMFTSDIASKFNVPRISFVVGCFPLLCFIKAYFHQSFLETITSDTDFFTLPGFPEEIKFTKAQLPIRIDYDYERQFWTEFAKVDFASYGVIVDTFEELEPTYVDEYRKTRGGKVWCVGPVSLCNQDNIDKTERGNVSSIDEHMCLNWLDNQQHGSVVYACLGSGCNLPVPQLIELGLGLEATKKPFIWVITQNDKSKKLDEWINDSKFEERIEGRGLVIRGWAPQLLILSHSAVGGFLTHCGWNSTIEGITAGVPLLTWPLFAEQFCNEKLVVHELKIGVRVGVEYPNLPDAEDYKDCVLIKKEDLTKKIEMLMSDGDEAKARRERAKELSIMAKNAVEKGGSSSLNTRLFIQDVMEISANKKFVEI